MAASKAVATDRNIFNVGIRVTIIALINVTMVLAQYLDMFLGNDLNTQKQSHGEVL